MPGTKSPSHRRNASAARKGKTRKKIPGTFTGGLDHLTNPEAPHEQAGGAEEAQVEPAPRSHGDSELSDGSGPQDRTDAKGPQGQTTGMAGKLPRIDLGKPDSLVEEAEPLEPDHIPYGEAKPQKMTKEQRRVEALNYRAAGYDYREIAEALKVSTKTAYYDVQAALEYLRKYERVLAEDVRALMMTRMDKMITYLWPAVERGETYSHAQVLNIMARQAKLLGLDAPVEVDVNIRRPLVEATQEELLGLARKLQEARPIPQSVLSTSTPLTIDSVAVRAEEVERVVESVLRPDQFTEDKPPTDGTQETP
jgi:predicted DNA-binding protein YlxM (UPF0122 family)